MVLHALLLLGWRGPVRPPGLPGAHAVRTGVPAAGGADAIRVVAVEAGAGRVHVPPPPPPLAGPEEPRIGEVEVTARAVPPAASRRGSRPVPPGAGEGEGGPGSEPSVAPAGGSPSFVPPAPRSILPEWDPPAGTRGREVTVRVRVDARGRPTAPVELRPPTGDEAFDRRLVEKVLRMEFEPARRGGEPVAAWAELTFVF